MPPGLQLGTEFFAEGVSTPTSGLFTEGSSVWREIRAFASDPGPVHIRWQVFRTCKIPAILTEITLSGGRVYSR